MSEKILCPYCLSPLEGQRKECPFCGKSLENINPPGTLPFAYLLGSRYTIGKVLQVDGEGILYEAVENVSGFRVNIKEYLPVTLSSGRDENLIVHPKQDSEVLFKTTRMDFADLYKTVQRITPATGLVAVLDVLEANGTVCAVLEVTQGIPLERYLALRSGPLLPEEARSLMQPVMEGVAALHKIGLVHRGVAPDNIRITEGGLARLGGYATLGLRNLGSELKAQLYEGYSAPEQYFPEQFEGRYTDVYSVAAVFYRLITGQAPVPAIQRKVMDSLPAARQVEHSVPGYLSAVLGRAMRLEPSERVQNIPELMGALASQNAANALMERGPKGKEPAERRSPWGALTAALLAICILLILLAWSILRFTTDKSTEPIPESSSSGTSSSGEETLYVPGFVGQMYTDVMKNQDYQEVYRFRAVYQHSSAEEGTVIDQRPAQGSVVQEGDIIELIVSQGNVMPDILGFTLEDAARDLNDLNIQFNLLEKVVTDGSAVNGCVISTEPVAGEKVTGTVNVYYALTVTDGEGTDEDGNG